jgi:hypothetical protein
MMLDACLVDTNVLLRITRRSDPNHAAVDNALFELATQGTERGRLRPLEPALGAPAARMTWATRS